MQLECSTFIANAYLEELSSSPMKTIRDLISFNQLNTHVEHASAGEHAAFESCQDRIL